MVRLEASRLCKNVNLTTGFQRASGTKKVNPTPRAVLTAYFARLINVVFNASF